MAIPLARPLTRPFMRFAVRAVAAAASRQIAARVSGSPLGPIGNVAAVALPFVLRRVSPLGLAAMAVGAWGVGQLAKAAPVAPAEPAPLRKPLVTPPPIAWATPNDAF